MSSGQNLTAVLGCGTAAPEGLQAMVARL